jgi:hypothetical protein
LREFGDVLLASSQVEEGLAMLANAVQAAPTDSINHRQLIHALETHRGIAATLETYQLVVPSHVPAIGSDAVVAFVVVRDELDHARSLLAHHRALGVDHFFVVDNGSVDGTSAFFQTQPDVTVVQAAGGFKNSACGSSWVEVLARFVRPEGGWILTIDADERLILPTRWDSIRAATKWLDEQGHCALAGVHLDLYSKGPVSEAELFGHDNLLEICPFFDRVWYTRYLGALAWNGGVPIWEGGVRARVFPPNAPLLTKVPLLRWDRSTRLQSGWHNIGTPHGVCPTARAVVAHGKFTSQFVDRATVEAERKEHFADAVWYQPMSARFLSDRHLTLFDSDLSVAFEGREHLEMLRILSSTTLAPVDV